VVVDDLDAPAAPRVTLLESGQAVEATMQGRRLTIRVPAALAARLPERQAYTFKIAGAK
jgi:hypothetical protein